MYENRKKLGLWPEIHDEYLLHDTPFLLPHHFIAIMQTISIAINTTRLKGNNVCRECSVKFDF